MPLQLAIAILLATVSFAVASAVLWLARRRFLEALRLGNERAERTRLGKVEIELAELRELYGALLESHKKLRSRIARRAEHAERAEQADNEVPDWRVDPAAARRALEAKHGIPSLG